MASSSIPSKVVNKKTTGSRSTKKIVSTKAVESLAASTTPDVAKIFKRLTEVGTEPQTQEPNKTTRETLDDEINQIYGQARIHRQLLIKFFIWYTCILSVLVMAIIFIQLFVRLYIPSAKDLEVVPQWALYLLVVGMFGQFISLLTIVTTKVWTFEPFLNHTNHTDSHDDQSS